MHYVLALSGLSRRFTYVTSTEHPSSANHAREKSKDETKLSELLSIKFKDVGATVTVEKYLHIHETSSEKEKKWHEPQREVSGLGKKRVQSNPSLMSLTWNLSPFSLSLSLQKLISNDTHVSFTERERREDYTVSPERT